MRDITCQSCGGDEFEVRKIYTLEIPNGLNRIELKRISKKIKKDIFICNSCKCPLIEELRYKSLLEIIVVNTPRDKIRVAKEYYKKFKGNIFFIFSTTKEMLHLESQHLLKRSCSKYFLKEKQILHKNLFSTSIFLNEYNISCFLHKNIYICLTDLEFQELDQMMLLDKYSTFFNIRFPD